MQSEAPFSFNARYGVESKPSWVIPAIVIALIALPWITWAGMHHSKPQIRSYLISFAASSDREIALRYGVERRSPKLAIICTVVARDIDKNVVGQIDDHIAGGAGKVERRITIPTRSEAVNADVIRCRTA